MKASTISILAGLALLAGGLVALLFPLPASLAVTVFIGAVFLVGGVSELYAGLFDAFLPGRWWMVASGLLSLVLGVWLLANPLAGLVSLTIAVAILFVLSGAGRIALSLSYRGGSSFWLVLLSGLVSIGLGVYVLANPATASPILLATLLAIELLSVGAMLLALGFALRNIR
ncbi:MAG: DUF308 domain-containing protein [Gemmobacter sp.]|jgi:uncharacterized membrane protein HdeD (DUF308 family)|nr:DUF308 domain-containing protein [Gemmobacter sp.]